MFACQDKRSQHFSIVYEVYVGSSTDEIVKVSE